MTIKNKLRQEIGINKDKFEELNDNKYIVYAAIQYAIYTAIGGTKLIALPPFTDKIYNIVYKIAHIQKLVPVETTDESLDKLLKKIESMLGNNISISINKQNNTAFISGAFGKSIVLFDSTSDILSSIIFNEIVYMSILDDTSSLREFIRSYLIEIGR